MNKKQKMNYTFRFKVKYWNASEILLSGGLGIASSYAEAVAQLENFYGNDLISILLLELYDEGNLLFLPEDCLDIFSESECPSIDFSVKSSDQKGIAEREG